MARRRGLGIDFIEALPPDGERRLMLAVLIDAIRSLRARHSATVRLRAYRAWLHDRAWLQSDDRSQLFSFMNICDSLGLNAEYIRRCVLRPPPLARPGRLHRYAAKAEESWFRQQRHGKDHAVVRCSSTPSAPVEAPPASSAVL